jgi:hypothetical protein
MKADTGLANDAKPGPSIIRGWLQKRALVRLQAGGLKKRKSSQAVQGLMAGAT